VPATLLSGQKLTFGTQQFHVYEHRLNAGELSLGFSRYRYLFNLEGGRRIVTNPIGLTVSF
jgi:hypothetical protein